MILRLYRAYKTGKTIYTKFLKPFYKELRKDAYASDEHKRTGNSKKKKTNAINQKPKRRNSRKANS